MKRILWILGFSALVLGVVSCDLNSLNVPLNDGETGNNIYVNPNTHWPPSKTPAYIGDISAYPQELQTVIKQRFSKQVSMETAGVIFAGPSELSAHADKLTDAANSGAFVVTPTVSQLSLLGANPKMAPTSTGGTGPLFVCYSGWGAGHFFMMYDEPVQAIPEPGESSMSDEQWQELASQNRLLGADGGDSVTDYDNDPAHNENYYHTRINSFISWLDAEHIRRSDFAKVPLHSSYDQLQMNIEQSGQRLTVDVPISINAYIDQATWSNPDYLNKSSSVSIDFWVLPSYMLSSTGDKAGDYYSIVSCITPHNEAMWGPYVGEHGACRNRIYGFWFADMKSTISLLDADGNAIPGLEYYSRPIPENPNSSKTYSDGTSYSYSGSISGGVSGDSPYLVETVSWGATYSSSTNYTLDTINYSLDSSTPDVKYHHWSENVVLTDDWDDWDKINKNFPAPVRTEFAAHSSWVWHVPASVVKDGDTQQFQLSATVSIDYRTWYHWRASIEYDDNMKDHWVDLPVQTWTLDKPDRTPWGFVSLRNASDYEMAHVSIYKAGHESEDPIAVLSTSYGKGDEALAGLWEGPYSLTWDFVDGNTGSVVSSWIYENVQIHQGKDKESATVKISSVDGKPRK
ncbi:MAG: hypothetical protein SPK76_06360 [Bacteroidales bacterium]|nr:hypothetical protein [Bacteroidales bacterium]MDY6444634.1 hypothetical protein [Bacteroidales bacterium]